jgi:hypothetical protein
LFAQGAGNYFTEPDTNFSSITPITMMGYSAAKFVPANGSRNIMVSNDIWNTARPQKIRENRMQKQTLSESNFDLWL